MKLFEKYDGPRPRLRGIVFATYFLAAVWMSDIVGLSGSLAGSLAVAAVVGLTMVSLLKLFNRLDARFPLRRTTP